MTPARETAEKRAQPRAASRPVAPSRGPLRPATTSGCACGGSCPACRPAVAARPPAPVRSRPGSADEAEADRFADTSGGARPQRPAAPRHSAPPANRPLHDGGRPLDADTRAEFEARLGADLSRLRIHDDGRAAASAEAERAHAYTWGEHIVFGAGEYRPHTPRGRHLLAHELAHGVQQGAAPERPGPTPAGGGSRAAAVNRRSRRQVQGSFWDDVSSGIQAVGSAIGSAAEAVGRAVSSAAQWVGGAISTAAEWLGERVHDVAQWAVSLVAELPARLLRLGQTLVQGFWGVLTFIPEAIRALASGGAGGLADFLWERLKSGGAWVLTLLSRLFDVMGAPEALEFVIHLASRATPLTAAERTAGQSVLGENALQWDQVRIAEGGVLHLVFALNGGRALTTWHTINMPVGGDHGRSNVAIVVHELTHVMQYEHVGTLYMGQAIHAQATIGYGYDGAAGLRSARAAGRTYASFNREQQAQIAQDYYAQFVSTGTLSGPAHEAYEPFIAELRAGRI